MKNAPDSFVSRSDNVKNSLEGIRSEAKLEGRDKKKKKKSIRRPEMTSWFRHVKGVRQDGLEAL